MLKVAFVSRAVKVSGGEIIFERLVLNNPHVAPVFVLPPGPFMWMTFARFSGWSILSSTPL